MIICPNCKEEIDDDSHYCDQCGQALLYCNRCGRVGIGRRCTFCGGLMLTPDAFQKNVAGQTALSSSASSGFVSREFIQSTSPTLQPSSPVSMPNVDAGGIPSLILFNPSLNIRIQGINGAVIGRRQGPYAQFFQQNMYVSGVHAQLKYKSDTGWCITDKHSSNGTKLNDRPIQPDVEMSIKNGDIVSIANISLQVGIN